MKNNQHKMNDIDKILELIFSTGDIIDDDIDNINEYYNRIFTRSEKIYLPVELQGLIQRMLNILTPEESESLISRALQTSYSGKAGSKDIWDILNEVVDDQDRLELISQKIPEFNNFFADDYKFIN